MSAIEKVEEIIQVSELYLKGYKQHEIARELNMSPAYVGKLVREYKDHLSNRALNDPDFLERIGENTLEAIEQSKTTLAEAWKTHEEALNYGSLQLRISALKLVKEIQSDQAKLLQLMGAKQDNGTMARQQRLEQTNKMVIDIIQEVIADCPRCRPEVGARLARAQKVMGDRIEADPEEIIDAEVVE